ncbi:MAG: outer membrane protein assembly factor BamA [Spirochaetes bacterium RBG_16_49_21]|nr:MAG: outer membrane protein assembly factor BamA [Spirochaetes bacterium RBG_16_49_21]
MTIIIAASLCFPQFIYPQASKYEGKIVKKIYFQGLNNVDEADLQYMIKTTVGYPLKAEEIRGDIKKIFKKGNFESIVVEIEEYDKGVRIRFICKERPVIKSVEFKGIKEVSETDLTAAIPIKEGGIIRKDYLEKSVNAIKKKYEDEGLFNAVVRYEVKPVRGDENTVKVIFIIDEGEEIQIRKLSLLGVKNLNTRELASVMDTSERGLFKEGEFKKDVWEQDKARLLAYYQQYGYLDAQILDENIEYEWTDPEKREKRCIFITLKISEGEQYYFDKYTVQIAGKEGETVFTPKEIMKEFEQETSGAVFDNTLFQRDQHMISYMYATKGYIFARVIPKRIVNEREVVVDGKRVKRKFVTAAITIEEGSQAYIEMIIVKGNKKTKDKVIKRELTIREGELFNSAKVQLSREKVYNLGFFKQVNIDVRPGGREGYVNLIVDVEEQPSGTISLGGGYGTTSGFSIFADVAENNLLGNGQRVGVKFEYGPQRQSVSLSFNERWLFNFPVGLNTSVFYNLYKVRSNQTIFSTTGSDEARYNRQAFGYGLGLSYRFLDYQTIGGSWTHAFTKVTDPTGNSSEEIFYIQSLGYQQKRSVTLFVAHDSRDNYLNPTRGASIDFAANFTGGNVLGGTDHFIRLSPSIFFYFSPFHLPFLKTHPCVFEVRVSGDFIVKPFGVGQIARKQEYRSNVLFNIDLKDPWLEPEDRLNLGGPETLRGWDYYDKRFPQSWQSVGLFHRILYGIEFRVPIVPSMLWLALFVDAGSLWSDPFWEKTLYQDNRTLIQNDLDSGELYRIQDFGKVNLLGYFRYSYGFGFRIQIPMMPLRFWFGQKVVYEGRFRQLGGFTFQFAIGDLRF